MDSIATLKVNVSDQTNHVDGLGIFDLMLIAAKNIKILIAVSFIAGILGWAVTYTIKPVYTAKVVLLPPQQQQSIASAAMQSLGALAGLAGAATGLKSPADQYVALLQSRKVGTRIVEGHDLTTVYLTKSRQTALETLAQNVKIEAGKKDGLIAIAVDDVDPQRAAAIANDYVEQLRRLTTELAVTEAQQRRVFFEKQLQQTRIKLTAAQQNLQGSGINEGVIRSEPKAAAEVYANLKAQVTATEIKLQSMRSALTENSQEFKATQATADALRQQLKKAELVNPSAAVGDYIGKYREFKYQETLFEIFAKQFELAKIDESREGALIQVVDEATPPEYKSRPRRVFIAAMAAVSMGVLYLVIIFTRESWLALKKH